MKTESASPTDEVESLAAVPDAILKTLNYLLCNFSQRGESELVQAKHVVLH